MSVESWKNEFYPIAAAHFRDSTDIESTINHSLKKWQGAHDVHLLRHGLKQDYRSHTIRDASNSYFNFSTDTCSLCQMFKHGDRGGCKACPLDKYTKACSGSEGMPYRAFLKTNNPEPMIDALKKALEDVTQATAPAPAPAPALISMDKQYKTWRGEKVRILCTDNEGDYPVVGIIKQERGTCIASWTAIGRMVHDIETNDRDLIEVKPFEDFKINEPVMVRDHAGEEWLRRYFAGVSPTGNPQTYSNGGTAWSSKSKLSWTHCRRPTPEELAE